MKKDTQRNSKETIWREEFSNDQVFPKILGIPKDLEIEVFDMSTQAREVSEELGVTDSPAIKYHAGRVIAITPTARIESEYIACSKPSGKICNMKYRFKRRTLATVNNVTREVSDLFSETMTELQSHEELKSLNFWLMKIIVEKLSDLSYFTNCHGNSEFEFVSAVEA